jgi:hypothetical protein
MKPGVGWILAGVALLGAAIVVTLTSDQVIWYGGMIVGAIWIVRGIVRFTKASKAAHDQADAHADANRE